MATMRLFSNHFFKNQIIISLILSLPMIQFLQDLYSLTQECLLTEGKTYTLKIKSDNGIYAEAICTVPLKGKIDLEIDTTRLDNYNQRPDYIIL